MAQAKRTTDHDEIRRWVEECNGFPATIKRTHQGGDPGLLRIDFPGFSGENSLQKISWEEWFCGFEENELAFLYQDERDNRFNKIVSRSGADDKRAESFRHVESLY